MASWSKESVLVLIEMYRSEESLWKVKSKDYSNRLIKEKAYEKMVDFVKTFEPQANKDIVLRKINNLRGSFRKELRKVEGAKLSGVPADEIYHPRLWYFSRLLFLKDQEIQSKGADSSTSTTSRQGHSFHHRQQTHETDDTLDSENSSLSFDEDIGESVGLDLPAATCLLRQHESATSLHRQHESATSLSRQHESATCLPRQHESALHVRHPPKRKSCDDEQQSLHYNNDNNYISGNRLATPHPATTATATTTTPMGSVVREEDEFDVYCKSMAWKLRHLPREQRIHVEKLFADVLYEAELGNLSRQSVVSAKPFSEETIMPHSSSQAHVRVNKIETMS